MLKAKMIRGLTTAWLQKGDAAGPIFFFVHGFPDDPSAWNEQMEAFSRFGTVICPFSRGTGPSEAGIEPHRFTITSIVMDFLAIVDDVDPDRSRKIVLCAHDIGGLYIIPLAELLGDRVSALVMINSVTMEMMLNRFQRPGTFRRSWYLFLFQVPRVPEFILEHFFGWVKAKLKDRPGLPVQSNQMSQSINQYRGALRSVSLSKILAPMKPLPVPLLSLWGCHDPYLAIGTASELKKISQKPTVRVLESGHWPQTTHAEKVNRYIQDFLQDVGVLSC